MRNKNKIHFQNDGSPYNEHFDDIYFDTGTGYLQSEQVFIEGNQLKDTLLNEQDTVTIGETGFGTGLNFLLTMKLYAELKASHLLPKIHFITTEKYPLTLLQLKKSLACLPRLASWSELLIEQYPTELCNNTTLSFFDGKITLSIMLGDAVKSFKTLTCQKLGLIDVWYLDGFSPTKNPEMWRDDLFQEMGRLSRPEASVATFTVAGIVRRGLIENGFRIKRIASGGKKKEILVGKFQQSTRLGKSYQLRPLRTKPQHVSIIGGGIASACLAFNLIQQGIKVTLYCKDEQLAQGASSNNIGALYPLIHQKRDELSVFYQQALQHARHFYQSIINKGALFSYDWCGLLELSFNDKLRKRQQGIVASENWPTSLIQSLNAQEASQKSGLGLKNGGLFIPDAGWLAPQSATQEIFKLLQNTGLLKVKLNVDIEQLVQLERGKWQLNSNKGKLYASNVVIAAGADSIKLKSLADLPLQPVKGQVSVLSSNPEVNPLSTVICHKGYLTPADSNMHCIGATFDKNNTSIETDEQADQYNLSMLNEAMGTQFGWQTKDIKASKARIRCMTPDHLPIAGPMADVTLYPALFSHLAKDKNWRYQTPAPFLENLYVMTGLGARGICSSPLLAEILTADICGTPYPVNNQMLFSLSSNRFVIRDIIKRKIAL
ncbi:bifunctional tRNA (5-methylaminomethyl-2-thiouridine)(34)-methyltransferase MnmD/FAD-dependent 5-carboxymethylaminomethyl-2-thiouridine(34) oxidoreductase MnmC [Thalassotalea sediminis]|uniref:bifunctional tRNA (5-methylaminomethyl-2-thiouridine)(34)-methyltransferase MnmD/FAD-dependent 5-carboxymethylaminomethyl-2-thiouridine(34) oxidoreductase MnmC n=1 Tax=Thalassotalea sediminis TaxID=1759089 RepID=UPI00257411C2|nr:bifunctional tRNA (5-methylaminomethyl-2-thiouridine)(34)-methyltransferase MnmD/FAD-dependent 5-carboxymethylaminomethyl-2-thiouridine(34) oxidoreductase MnmC [Thalassotalea sediminis]